MTEVAVWHYKDHTVFTELYREHFLCVFCVGHYKSAEEIKASASLARQMFVTLQFKTQQEAEDKARSLIDASASVDAN